MSATAQPLSTQITRTAWYSRVAWERDGWVWGLWAIFAVVVAVNRFTEVPVEGNVFLYYRDAAVSWLAGEPLYNGTGCGVIYLPQAYLLFTPFTLVPFNWGGAIWRVLNIAMFAAGVWQFARLASRGTSRNLFAWVSLPVMLLSWSAARHGQMTMAMGGMMLLAVVDLADCRWWRATLWLVLSVLLKPLALVLVLLAVVIYPRTSWRLVIGAGLAMLLPLLAQHPSYVLQQYALAVKELGIAARVGGEFEFAHLFWLLRATGLDIPTAGQTAIRLLAAGFTLVVCWLAARRCPPAEAGVVLYTLAVGYLMLFNPRTENNTYCLLAPALGVFAAQAVVARHRPRIVFLFGLMALFLASHPLGKALHEQGVVWIKPLLCSVFLALVLWQLARGLATKPASSMAAS
jgi:hypothetical protein